jgi:Holliday junction resolvase
MSKLSRDKGKRGEREVCHALDRRGLPYLREQDGRTQGADFLIDRRFTAEVKRREKFSLLEAHRHVEGLSDKHLTPVVIWRPSHQPWRVSMLLEDWLDLITEAGS